ncbi:MAG TPA: hypothetical protein VGH33_18470 [Isosphaeraceae bacterium]
MIEAVASSPDRALERRWETIRGKLVAHADLLAHQGTLASTISASGRRVWAIRVVDRAGGRRVQRNLYVGGVDQPELLARTREWLDRCRARTDEVDRLARLAATVSGVARRVRPGLGPAARQTSP